MKDQTTATNEVGRGSYRECLFCVPAAALARSEPRVHEPVACKRAHDAIQAGGSTARLRSPRWERRSAYQRVSVANPTSMALPAPSPTAARGERRVHHPAHDETSKRGRAHRPQGIEASLCVPSSRVARAAESAPGSTSRSTPLRTQRTACWRGTGRGSAQVPPRRAHHQAPERPAPWSAASPPEIARQDEAGQDCRHGVETRPYPEQPWLLKTSVDMVAKKAPKLKANSPTIALPSNTGPQHWRPPGDPQGGREVHRSPDRARRGNSARSAAAATPQ